MCVDFAIVAMAMFGHVLVRVSVGVVLPVVLHACLRVLHLPRREQQRRILLTEGRIDNAVSKVRLHHLTQTDELAAEMLKNSIITLVSDADADAPLRL